MASKIVVIGSVSGSFRELFSKLSKVQTKNNFSLALITGNLFGTQSDEDLNALLSGSISVPLPTYFGLGSTTLPAPIIQRLETDQDVCDNLFFLGRRGTYKTAEGIRIVTLGGKLAQESPSVANGETKYLPSYVEGDARALYGAHSADIVITNEWPLGIKTGSKITTPADVQAPEEQQAIADIVTTLKPRYHLSSSSFFYEREPFFHLPTEEESLEKPITRFISLAPFNNETKQKWLYAFSLDPKASVQTTVPTGVTASPLSTSKKRSALQSQGQSYARFSGHDEGDRPRKRQRGQQRGPQNHGPEECFFCLSNPNVATHMLCSIGNESYVTIAKGPLPLRKTFPTLDFPMHMLIMPLAHASKFDDIKDDSSPKVTYDEMQRYRLAMYDMIAKVGEGGLGAVCWEVSRKFVRHFVWQLIPMQVDKMKRGLVEAAFKVSAEKANLPAFTKFPANDIVPPEKGDYFRVWFWTPPVPGLEDDANKESNEKSLLLQINEEVRFDIQFGRKVMANLLQLESRTFWQDAAQTEAEETAAKDKFMELFKPYDIAEE